MGNSPSRNELHGDHMSNIVNNSGQETFQSHSYPAKFSSVPGIHNEQFNGPTVVSAAAKQSTSSGNQHPQSRSGSSNGGGGSSSSSRNGMQNSGGPNTPDLLYSMDSLNVCGNNSASITSAELPPSSISPANCRDPWNPSPFSDESLHTQCRNLSRLHKDQQPHTDDEGLSSATSCYESDSLNPDATLSGMVTPKAKQQHQPPGTRPYSHHSQHHGSSPTRETSPALPSAGKAEVAEEATEYELPLLLRSSSQQRRSSDNNCHVVTTSKNGGNGVELLLPCSSGNVSTDQHSITINGRKVSGCEETPLPIIVGLQKDADLNSGSGVSSKIGITSSELSSNSSSNKSSPSPPHLLSSICSSSGGSGSHNNGSILSGNGTIKRGSRMKSPPPPPPPAKANGAAAVAAPTNNTALPTSRANNDISSHYDVPMDKKQNNPEKAATASPSAAESCDKMSSLNTLMRRNVPFGGSIRKSCTFQVLDEDMAASSSAAASDDQVVCGGGAKVNVIETKKEVAIAEKSSTSSRTADHDESATSGKSRGNSREQTTKSTQDEDHEPSQTETLVRANNEAEECAQEEQQATAPLHDFEEARRSEKSSTAAAVASPLDNDNKRSSGDDKAKDIIIVPLMLNPPKSGELQETLSAAAAAATDDENKQDGGDDDDDPTTDILIRPCELSKQSYNHTISGDGGEAGDNDCNDNSGISVVGEEEEEEKAALGKSGWEKDYQEKGERPLLPLLSKERMVMVVEEEEDDRHHHHHHHLEATVNEQNHDTTNKTELDCKDAKEDGGGGAVVADGRCTNIADYYAASSASATADTATDHLVVDDDEIKPVSCSSNVEEEDKKEENCTMLSSSSGTKLMMNSNKKNDEDSDKKFEIDGNKASTDPISDTENAVVLTDADGEVGVEFPEMSYTQLDTGFGSAAATAATNAMKMKNAQRRMMLFDSPCSTAAGFEDDASSSSKTKKQRRDSHNGRIDSKFGTDEQEQQSDMRRGELLKTSRESTPSRQPIPPSCSPPSSLSPVISSAAAAAATTEADLIVLTREESKSGKSSNSSSRRGSLSSSSVDLNVVVAASSNGILSCNRISLCSLPDNEVDVDSFESPPPPVLDSETILDQPMTWKPSCQILTQPDEPVDQIISDNDENGKKRNRNDETSVGKNLKTRNLKSEAEHQKHGANVSAHHQRKLSISKIEFDCSSFKGDKRSPTSSSAPTSTTTSQYEKHTVTRKASFPELYVNTTAAFVRPSIERKLSVGAASDKTYRGDFNIPASSLCNGDSTPKEQRGRSKSSQFAKNDFLQTLGEIYACKSKLLTSSNPQLPPTLSSSATAASIMSRSAAAAVAASSLDNVTSAKESTTATECTPSMQVNPSEKLKSRDASIETVDGFECQDRSISEYNISPRSARELVTESLLLNGAANSSICSSTVSQISIVTVNDSEKSGGTMAKSITSPTLPVPFSAGVETRNPFNVTTPIKSGDLSDVDGVIPRLAQSPSLANGNSATFRKKPSFGRGKVPTGNINCLPSVDIFETPIDLSCSTKNAVVEMYGGDEDVIKSVMPTPPPMPPLQYCRNNSYSSTASSSIGGDSSSETHEKSKSPCFEETIKTVSFKKVSNRASPERTAPKLNGSASSECSLIELSLANQRSTSDAIIVELKKAQARKLKFAAAQKTSAELYDQRGNMIEQSLLDKPLAPAPSVAIVQVAEAPTATSSSRQEVCQKKGLDENKGDSGSNQETINETNSHVGDFTVKTIVNGKHTNSIIVNETPVSLAKKESVKRTRSSVNAAKSPAAQQRGNIMSPSLSGNYTEMNGIDSETMGASSIHEDELSGHLKQKENHINELHDNADEVQTSNKLDGASFRRVLSEYEKTLSMFIQQIDQLKQRMDEAETEKQTLIKERDQALEDLRNVESAFSDVHRKYERAKALLENMKSNEDTLIRRDQEMMQRIQNRDKKIDMIKEKAQESIEKMHLDYETRIKEMEFENAKLRAQYRKMEMKLSTLENDVEQKAKENAQLSALCDELINGQVGQV